MSNIYKFDEDECFLLPVGLYRNGKYYREIHLDGWVGMDQEQLTSASTRKNPSRGLTAVLQRLTQEITGLMERKRDPFSRCAAHWFEDMFQCDRDAILLKSLVLSDDCEQEVDFTCPKCQEELVEDVDLRDLEIHAHGEGSPFVDFTLQSPIRLSIENTDSDKKKFELVEFRDVRFHLPTGKNQAKVSQAAKKGEHHALSVLISQCLEIKGFSGRLTIEQVRRLRKKTRREIQEALSELTPGVDLTKRVECPSCGAKSDLMIDLSNFFR